MQKQALKNLRDHLSMDRHEVLPEKVLHKVFARCIIKGGAGTWEQGAVAGYMPIRGESYALVAYSERPASGGLPQFDFVKVERLGKFRKPIERQFKLRPPVTAFGR